MKRNIFIIALLIVCAAGIIFADTASKWTRATGAGNNLAYYDATWSPTASIWNTAPQLAGLDPKAGHVYTVDFDGDADTLFAWTIKATDVGGTHACVDSAGGYYKILTHTTDNDEAYLYQRVATWLFATSKPLWFEWYGIPFASTDSTYSDNFIIGLVSTAAGTADLLVDDGAGPPSNYTGAVFYKSDAHGNSSGYWRVETSETTTQQSTTTTTAFASVTKVRLGIYYNGAGSTLFYINGALVATHSTTDGTGAPLRIVIGAKAGAGNRTALYTDYIKCFQVR